SWDQPQPLPALPQGDGVPLQPPTPRFHRFREPPRAGPSLTNRSVKRQMPSAETARRLSCDAGLVEVRADPDGRVLGVGRRTRTVPPALRRALEVRDRGCRFPGCGLRFTDAHHIVHWADGGETSLANCVLLCRRHHRRVHEEGWRVSSDRTGERIVFFTPAGRALAEVPDRCEGGPSERRPSEHLSARLRARGLAPDHRSCGQRFRHDDLAPWTLEAAAYEALE